MSYVTPPSFSTGDYLSAYKLRLLAANDDYFNGIANALRMVPTTMGRNFIGNEPSLAVFDGYIYLTQNSVNWTVYLSDNAGGNKVTLYLDYGGAGQMSSGDITAIGETSGTFDTTALTKNALYRVYCLHSRTDTGANATAELRRFYETYTGALSFTAPNAFTDGTTSAATHLQALSDNDSYFRAIESENHPVVGITHNVGQNQTLVIWRGWIKHKHDKINYRLKMAGTVGWTFGGTLTLYYGYGDALQETVATVNTETTSEGSHTLVNAFVTGTWYQVAAVVVCGNGVAAAGTVYYVEEGAATPDTGFTPLGEFAPGQFVWGTTANQRTRLALLGANDSNLNGRLELCNHAVKKALYPELGGNLAGTYAIRRRKNVLYYRGKNLTMTWGSANSMNLTDYDGSHPYQTLDLGGIANLVPGQVYYIASSSSEAEFAQERET